MIPHLPAWLVLAVGAVVILFGLFRLRLAFRSPADEESARDQKGMFGYPRRTHGLFGLVYILMGVLLILGALGVRMPWMH
jgi:hypothetical protein